MSSGPPPNPDDQPTLPPHEAGSEEDVEVSSAYDATIGHAGSGTRSKTPHGSEALPELEDYQLLEELGRGGMGVVYRARHKSLDRTVALKMILGGQFASSDEVRRFQLEAESAARLDHPGIVPVYEVGASQGNHFFSMKLIDGLPLADCPDAYVDAEAAARMLVQVARAVQHAHERGVLHRDLKPANILVDAEGQPMLTDLGLAKRMDDDSGLTRTGLVMGSPGFMSPEQAAGKSDVTTAADVYALGAILFWLITGRPPFQGETHLETIMQTIEQEPQSVQALRPDADRSLNLICQKALQKSPQDRYPSAAAFADDLQAWL
ncbi:MAG: serine/threonine-protein kinase, partial [Planctomycetota bacterium]